MNSGCSTFELEKIARDLRTANYSLRVLIDKVVALSGETDTLVLRSMLPALRDAAIEQFRREESIMGEASYAAAVQHGAEHQRLLSEVQNQIDAMERGSSNGSHIGQFLQSWFLQHIVYQDLSFIMTFTPDGSMSLPLLHQDLDPDVEDSTGDVWLDLDQPIRWTTKHAVDIQPIDENHKLIFSLISEIIDARASLDSVAMMARLERLGNETAAHFQNEEKVMADYHYPFEPAHRDEHRKLLEEFGYQLDEYRNGAISAELMCRFVYQWFVRHIEVSDIPLSNAIHRLNSESANR